MKSFPSSVRQLLTSRCTASSSRNSRNAYPFEHVHVCVHERDRDRETQMGKYQLQHTYYSNAPSVR